MTASTTYILTVHNADREKIDQLNTEIWSYFVGESIRFVGQDFRFLGMSASFHPNQFFVAHLDSFGSAAMTSVLNRVSWIHPNKIIVLYKTNEMQIWKEILFDNDPEGGTFYSPL